MTVRVHVADEQAGVPVEVDRWGALAEAVLRAEGVEGDAELSLLFVDEPAIAALNERYLGHAGPTDVLSFPIDEAPGPPGGPPSLLGDVVICPEVARRNAPSHTGTYEDELALLVVHGVLHVLGMDHEIPEEAEVMEAREQALLAVHHRVAP